MKARGRGCLSETDWHALRGAIFFGIGPVMSLMSFAQSPTTRCDASGIWNVPTSGIEIPSDIHRTRYASRQG